MKEVSVSGFLVVFAAAAQIFTASSCNTRDEADFLPNLEDHSNQIVPPTVAKVVWTFWDKGESSLPAFNQYAVNHWRKILAPEGYQVRVLNLIEGDKDNAITVLGGRDLLPSNFDQLESVAVTYYGPDGGEVKMVSAVVRSDAIRLAMLEKFGGIWMDSSNVLIEALDEVGVLALNQSKASVAGYIMDGYASDDSPIVSGKRVDGMENWLIIAKQHSPLIAAWRKAFIKYWETREPRQWISHHVMYRDPHFSFGGLGISAANYLNQHAALKYVLFKRPDLGEQILPLTNLKPWWLHGRAGGDARHLYQGIISPEISNWAKEIKNEKVGLLKFAGGHLTDIKEHFPSVDSYCHTPNLITLLYGHCP